jgi:hypothetical protein
MNTRGIETRALVQLSERLAPIENAPPRTIQHLAYSDDIDVAQPVLSKSERIVEADPIAIAKGSTEGRTTNNEQRSLNRDPYLLETNAPGVLACRDGRLSPVKRVASAVG